jgi:hypothetical protein
MKTTLLLLLGVVCAQDVVEEPTEGGDAEPTEGGMVGGLAGGYTD